MECPAGLADSGAKDLAGSVVAGEGDRRAVAAYRHAVHHDGLDANGRVGNEAFAVRGHVAQRRTGPGSSCSRSRTTMSAGCPTWRDRWYNGYQLPDRYDAQTITIRLHGNADDQARKFNRPENVRPIPPSDPDFARLYRRRNDSESINRNLEDTLWLGRAHSIGHARQHLNLLGYALMVNGLALHRHQRRRTQLAA